MSGVVWPEDLRRAGETQSPEHSPTMSPRPLMSSPAMRKEASWASLNREASMHSLAALPQAALREIEAAHEVEEEATLRKWLGLFHERTAEKERANERHHIERLRLAGIELEAARERREEEARLEAVAAEAEAAALAANPMAEASIEAAPAEGEVELTAEERELLAITAADEERAARMAARAAHIGGLVAEYEARVAREEAEAQAAESERARVQAAHDAAEAALRQTERDAIELLEADARDTAAAGEPEERAALAAALAETVTQQRRLELQQCLDALPEPERRAVEAMGVAERAAVLDEHNAIRHLKAHAAALRCR